MKQSIGVCLGASSVSFVKIEENRQNEIKIINCITIAHNGNPKEVFYENLKKFNPDKLPVVVTGRKFRTLINLDTISEPEATELAFGYYNKSKDDYAAIASLGGESFIVYTLDGEGKIANVISKNQCASGTGEFFLQQIKRMNLNVDEVVKIARNAEPHKVSGRCSVFCKSDCTHALNKGVPKPEVASGLALMMAEKVEELLKKVHRGKILVVGGVTQNLIVMDFLKSNINNIVIPEQAVCFEALGAALFSLKNSVKPLESFETMFYEKESSFVFHEPLQKFAAQVTFKQMERGKANDGDRCILGLDVGSTTTKAVIIRQSDDKILASVYLYTHGNPIVASRKCYESLDSQIDKKINIVGLGVTGSGRHIAGLHALTEGIFNEIVAHATAAVYFDNEVDTLFEIGGQDAKYTYIVNKVPADYAMNEACSAGTGSFIEESAHESLGIEVQNIEPIAMQGQRPPNFSDQCAAFISSDIKTALHENIDKQDIVAGLVYSICLNYINRVKGNRPIGKKIFMQGGVCYNKAIPIAMASLTGKEIIVPPEPGLMGAFGVALEVKEKIELGIIAEKEFILNELASRDVVYKKPFICAGGKEKCDLKCSINMIEVQGKSYPFGGACNKYYNLISHHIIDVEKFDFVKKRQFLTFEKYAPKQVHYETGKTVGINLSYHTHTIYPLYYNFFTKLGFKVIIPDEVDEKGLERELTSFCYPGQLALGLFQNLIHKNPDYYFVPNLCELHVNEEEHYRIDYNSTCVFVITEPFYLKQAFKDVDFGDRLIIPTLNFASGFGAEEENFVKIAEQMGVTDTQKVREAYKYAVKMQDDYQTELFSYGEQFLKHLESHPDDLAIVLLGRPYNSFTETANKGIPQKFASRGIYVIPYDMFDYRNEKILDEMYWEGGKKILKTTNIIKRHPQLFATYITNFSCGPDSMIIPIFRKEMGTKPSLTLELDGHTADAGVNTRIDAFLDIINNFLKLEKNTSEVIDKEYLPAKIDVIDDHLYYITSDGEKVDMRDQRVLILIPSMGDLSSHFFAAALRSIGFHSAAITESNNDILKYGRMHCSGKECLPLIICSGSLIDYMENHWDGKRLIAYFNVQSSGNCRIGQYPVFLNDLIERKKWRNVATFLLTTDNGYAGLGTEVSIRGIQALLTSDVLDDVRSAIMANSVDPEKGIEIFYKEFHHLLDCFVKKPDNLYKYLKKFANSIKEKIPTRIPINESKYIALVGEIYVRRDHFAHKWLNKTFAQKGFVLKDAYITEWLMYINYLVKIGLIEPDKSFQQKKERIIRDLFVKYAERRIKKILVKTGYYEYMKTDIAPLLKYSKHIIPWEIKGEEGLTTGTAIHETLEHYCGVINVGPFGCMPTRVSEAIVVPEMKVENKKAAHRLYDPNYDLPSIFDDKMTIPFLTIESDGNVFPQIIEAKIETFALQAERVANLMKIAKNKNYSNGKGKLNGNGTKTNKFNPLKIFTNNK